MGIRPWPTLTLLMEGGPDDGLVITIAAGADPEPPEELLSAVDPLGGRYLRNATDTSRSTWTYRWVLISQTAED